jgi:hypothetical protein
LEQNRPKRSLAVERQPNLLQESSLAVIFDYYKNEDFGIVTSWKAARPDGTIIKPGQNRAKYHDFLRKVHYSGFGFIQVYGIGQEKDVTTGKVFRVKEPSLLIPNRKYSQQDFNKGASNTSKRPVPFEEFRDYICGLGAFDGENPQRLVVVYCHQNNITYLIDSVTKGVVEEAEHTDCETLLRYFTTLRSLYTKERQESVRKTGDGSAALKTYTLEKLMIAKIPQVWESAQHRMCDGELFELVGEDEYIRKIGEVMEVLCAHPKRKWYSLK